MATTINLGFQKLRENLEITSLQSGTVSTRHTNVRNAVREELTVLSDFLTGSYIRNTMIAPLAKPRSAYLLSGPARSEWEHSIPAVDALRCSITFRNFRSDRSRG